MCVPHAHAHTSAVSRPDSECALLTATGVSGERYMDLSGTVLVGGDKAAMASAGAVTDWRVVRAAGAGATGEAAGAPPVRT